MRYGKRRRLNRKTTLFALLLLLSCVSLLVPPRYTGRWIGLVQVLTPFQDVANRAADSLGRLVTETPAPAVDSKTYEALVRESQSYQNTIASLSMRASGLEQANRELLGIRDRGLGSGGQLIPAHVISDDASPWRRSKLVDAGALRGVHAGAAVASHYFTAAAGGEVGVREGLQVLAGEALVGTVVSVAPYASRVRLLTDPETKIAVTIGRPGAEGVAPLENEFWLVGAARKGLQVRDVDHRYVENGAVAVGDIVLTSGDDTALPLPVVIGTITGVHRDQDNGLIYNLDVRPAVDPDRLRRVYVVDTGANGPAK